MSARRDSIAGGNTPRDDLRCGRPKPLYTTDRWADLTTTPLPRWELIDSRRYATMNIQYSRGCPYDCEFCDITVLYGRLPRTKSGTQVIEELEAIYRSGWRSHVFFVDDNFIGNRVMLKADVLPRIIRWMEEHGYPFSLGTEASLNLSDDPELLELMARAGFEEVFVGIETPNAESLEECKKIPNRDRDMIGSVRTLQKAGLQVQGGFIVGFDHDPPSIFDAMIEFIRESGIVVAMVGLLNAPINSRLYNRLAREERLLKVFSGNNTDFSMNFVPRMDSQALLDGYRKVLGTIYSPREYDERVTAFLRTHEPLGQHRDTRAYLRPNLEVDDKNVMPAEMVAFVQGSAGLSALARVGGDIELLKQLIAAGFLVVIEAGHHPPKDWWMGHYLVVSGYDNGQGLFWVQDSLLNPDVPTPYAELSERWWRDFNYVYLVIYPPEREAEVMAILGPRADETFSYQMAAERALEEIPALQGRDQFFAWFNLGSSRVGLGPAAACASPVPKRCRRRG